MTLSQHPDKPETAKAPRVPVNVDGLIPEHYAAIVLSQSEPEAVFAQLQDTRDIERPQVLCLDARDASPEVTRRWLEKFDALSEGQDRMKVQSPVGVPVVVFLGTQQSVEPFSDLFALPDFEYVLSDDRMTPLGDQYRNLLRKTLTAFMSRDPLEGLDREPGPGGRPIEDFLPEDAKEDWRQRLRELGCKDV